MMRLLHTNSSELYNILENVVYQEFEEEKAEEILSLLWQMFSKYALLEANEKGGKILDKIMEEIDEYFESSTSTDIKGEG